MDKTVSVVVPVYQNEQNLHDTVPKLLGLGARLERYRFELVFVDDGSTDSSYDVLRSYQEQHPRQIVIVKLTRNFGQVSAIQAGFRQATGDCVGVISADLQEPWMALLDMVQAWERGGKFIIGERHERQERWWSRKLSGLYWSLVRRFAFSDYPTMGYDFCLVDRQLVDDLNRINEKNTSIFVLAYWLGYKPVRVPIVRVQRQQGVSQWRLLSKVNFTIDMLIGFTYLPARLISIVGFTVALCSMLYLVFMLALWYRFRTTPLGWMTVVALLTLLGATILVALGILSEYLLRILDEARKRPLYVIDHVVSGGTSGRPTSFPPQAQVFQRGDRQEDSASHDSLNLPSPPARPSSQ